MHLKNVTAKAKPLGLTSLIDVIFLLLMFFMLASTFSKYQRLPVATGNSGQTTQGNERPLLVRVKSEENYFAFGKELNFDQLRQELSQQPKSRKLVILPAKETNLQDVVTLSAKLSADGYSPILIAE
ncbi:ExbD/TolR family protein [Polycladidibacter stylochi]|uniref:ExbD/TolR family protein n=1 Tax=Polycladidibacter stylochi TaxID=1807766 RepID=UPI000836205F|nr:biopolymer transporter ExbD [Pseudovibrio stylochi]